MGQNCLFLVFENVGENVGGSIFQGLRRRKIRGGIRRRKHADGMLLSGKIQKGALPGKGDALYGQIPDKRKKL